jgi:phage terminase Nu1 subunit (DNA packaging protein)
VSILATEFPHPLLDEIASVLCGSGRTNLVSVENAAVTLIQRKAMDCFMPLVSIALDRYSYSTRRLADIAIAELSKRPSPGERIVGRNEGFQQELKNSFNRIVDWVCAQCKEKLESLFKSHVNFIDGTLLHGMATAATESDLKPSLEKTRERVLAAVRSAPEAHPSMSRTQAFTEEGANIIRGFAAKLWAGVRFMMAKTASSCLNHDFFQPVIENLASFLQDHFHSFTEEELDELFQPGIVQLKQRVEPLRTQLQRLSQSRDRFKNVECILQARASFGN